MKDQNKPEMDSLDSMEDLKQSSLKLTKVRISKAVVDDAGGIQSLVSEASKGMYELCGWSPKEIDDHFKPEVIKEGAEKIGKSIATFTEVNILFVAKDENDKIIGCCFAERQKDTNRIEAVYISKEFQGTGLSKRLFDEAYKLLDPNNNTTLDVFSLNSKAINFYKKLGFSETGKKFFDEKYVGSTGKVLEITEMVLLSRRA
jgi:ribosomal protein S18 acetylase RimI-like enzyme